MRIFLIRHGESQANVDADIHQIIPDHDIALSPLGMEQAQKAGHVLKKYLVEHPPVLGPAAAAQAASGLIQNLGALFGQGGQGGMLKQMQDAQSQLLKARLWNSPYRRARETAQILGGIINEHVLDRREDVLLCEQQFGLFDGLGKDLPAKRFPAEAKCFEHQRKANGKFWARFPMGESPFDAACRIRQYFGTIKRDEDDKGISDHIIVCHGTVLKLFTMMWLHRKYEWFADEPCPGNCGIRLIEKDSNGDYNANYIYGGHRSGKPWEHKGNKYDPEVIK